MDEQERNRQKAAKWAKRANNASKLNMFTANVSCITIAVPVLVVAILIIIAAVITLTG